MNYGLPMGQKIGWSFYCILILICSGPCYVLELIFNRFDFAKELYNEYDMEVKSMYATLRSLWVPDDDFPDYNAYA